MTTTIGIEGERYKDQDVRSSNGILLDIQPLLPRPQPTS